LLAAVYIDDVTEAEGDPEAATAQHEGLWSELRILGLERDIASIRRLSGGYVADVWLVTYGDGTHAVGKTLTGVPAGIFRAEAEGLAALRATGHLQTPQVLAVTDRSLLLEALAPRDDRDSSWEAFAHDIAALHRDTVHDGFGWDRRRLSRPGSAARPLDRQRP
jgi:fructosamine-3-kinase